MLRFLVWQGLLKWLWFYTRVIVFLLVVCLFSACVGPVALALPNAFLSATFEQTFDAATIPSEKVSQFVRAYVQVLALVESQRHSDQGLEINVEEGRLMSEIEAENVASLQAMAFGIIEQYGLTKQEYFQMLSLANTDAEFGERVAAQLQADFSGSLSPE